MLLSLCLAYLGYGIPYMPSLKLVACRKAAAVDLSLKIVGSGSDA